jgi:hypothetical protein
MFVGGADASQKGLGDFIPAKFMLRSAIVTPDIFTILTIIQQLDVRTEHRLGSPCVTVETPKESVLAWLEAPRNRRMRPFTYSAAAFFAFVLFDTKFTFGTIPPGTIVVPGAPGHSQFRTIYTNLKTHSVRNNAFVIDRTSKLYSRVEIVMARNPASHAAK